MNFSSLMYIYLVVYLLNKIQSNGKIVALNSDDEACPPILDWPLACKTSYVCRAPRLTYLLLICSVLADVSCLKFFHHVACYYVFPHIFFISSCQVVALLRNMTFFHSIRPVMWHLVMCVALNMSNYIN